MVELNRLTDKQVFITSFSIATRTCFVCVHNLAIFCMTIVFIQKLACYLIDKYEGLITRKNLVHFRKILKQKSYRKIQKSYKNPKNL